MIDFVSLEKELSSFMNEKSQYFISYPNDNFDLAERWNRALLISFKNLIPFSKSVLQASQLFASKIMIKSDLRISFISAFDIFFQTLGLGMQPDFTAVVPPFLISNFYQIFILDHSSSENKINQIVSKIQSFSYSCSAVNNQTGVSVIWS